ncbi:hypothetical protein [Zophobihabitans entericus]|uniref:Uncharacterized protein n=1 Tax=Zophobihabitans entericus TaxID=1635327 RepID=A0A6G9IBT7_9GAMM|nr:hypothetical protein [Zophobihabitans entericus]QIQ21673.1 hypothetical protein IPMB12_08265 [Zophobihabitans entericus]
MKKSINAALLLILIGIISFILFNFIKPSETDSIYKNNARTYYEAIDFSTPESTSLAFISAWRSADYITFYILLHPDTQQALIHKAFYRLDILPFFPEKSTEIDETLKQTANMSNIESILDLNLYLDYLFNAARQHDALPFKLGEDARIDTVIKDDQQIIVTIKTDSQPQEISLYLKKLEINGRWKISYIQVPEFPSQSLLWGHAPNNEPN